MEGSARRTNSCLTAKTCSSTFVELFENKFARPLHAGRTGKRVKFPRCRATVSEDIAAGHWSDLGRPGISGVSRLGEHLSE